MVYTPFPSEEQVKLLLAQSEELRHWLEQAAPPAEGLRMSEVAIILGGMAAGMAVFGAGMLFARHGLC